MAHQTSKSQCPSCRAPVFDHVFHIHLTYCRQKVGHKENDTCVCPFNTMHVLPMSEREMHFKTCPDRTTTSQFIKAVAVLGINYRQTKKSDDCKFRVCSADALPSVPKWMMNPTSRGTFTDRPRR